MEREIFLGLSSKSGAWNTSKEDASNKLKDPVMSSGMKWSFSNKVSALPQFLSFKNNNQEDRPRKSVLDPVLASSSSGYMNLSTKDAFDSSQKPFLGVIQKNLSIGKQAGNKHGMNVYPEAQPASIQETRIFSVSNQSNQVNPVLHSNLVAANGINLVNSSIKPQPLGSKSSATPVSAVPSMGSIVGSTELRNCSKSPSTPAQLTIFYGGSVCVYDDIAPEKAQAIMLLAGGGSPPTQNKPVSTPKLQPAISIPSKDDGFIISQSHLPSPLPSPLPPLSSHATSQSRGIIRSSSSNELGIIRSVGPSTAPTHHLESPIIAASVGPSTTKMLQPVCLPQARKASLARFLEKRKERITSTSPYQLCKKSSECSSEGSDSITFSLNFSGSSLHATH